MPSCRPCRRTGARRKSRGLVAMRVRDHTLAFEQLQHYLATLPLPVVAALRDTQNYVQLAARGLTLWDVAPSRVERDLAQWAPLTQWLHDRPMTSATPTSTTCRPWSARKSAAATGCSSTRRRIDAFAQATGDHQWIHVDPVRAAASPFGGTMAHGFLTLSCCPSWRRGLRHRRRGDGHQLRPGPGALPVAGARSAAGCAAASCCRPSSRWTAARS
jgi:hypothetical protein